MCSRLLGTVPRVYIMGEALFPMLIFLLVYSLLYPSTRNQWVSAMAGVAVLLGYYLIPYIPLKPDLLFSQLINYEHDMRPIEWFSHLPRISFLLPSSWLRLSWCTVRSQAVTIDL